ncbi:MAG: HAD-IIB family hydrolase [Clostridia bacterium]|nr:HAD-IIB family hydrolase [Clostridia bacterium]
MKFQNCLLASDYDGTLYDDTGKIPASVMDAIKYYISEGGYFTVCTGRVLQGFHAYDSAYINAPVLLSNGACAYDYTKNQYAFRVEIGAEGIPLVRALAEKFPMLSIELYNTETICAVHMSKNTKQHFAIQNIEGVPVDDPAKSKLPWTKIMLLDALPVTDAVQAFIAEFCDDPVSIPTSGDWIEITKRGANKGTGVLRLADSLGVPHDRVFAVGDGYNDADMLRAARIGFAPRNGSREALAAADRIVRSNRDGAVAHVIEILDKMF